MPRAKKEESAKKKRLEQQKKAIPEPENIFDTAEQETIEHITSSTMQKDTQNVTNETKKEETRPQKAKKIGKKLKEAKEKIDKTKVYDIETAIELLKQVSYTKFIGTVELHLVLSEKELRGSISLPHGTGKKITIVAFVPPAKINEAKEAGADYAGAEELAEQIKTDKLIPKKDFNAVVADPSVMPILAPLAKILGPKGLMPNPKNGTVGVNIAQMIANLKKGQINYKAEQSNPYLIHLPIGKLNYENKKIAENIKAIAQTFTTNKIKKAYLSATMAPSIKIKL